MTTQVFIGLEGREYAKRKDSMAVEIFSRPKPTQQGPTKKPAIKPAEEKGPTTALVVKPKDASTGKFVKRTKTHAPTGREFTEYLREYVQGRLEVSDETGKLTKDSKKRMERILDNQIFIASDSTVEARSASVKAAQLILERCYGRAPMADEDRASMERAAVKIIIVTSPDLPNMGEIQPREKLIPSFIDAEVLHTNEPQLSAVEMQPEEKPKAPKAKPEPVLCSCQVDSRKYCVNLEHRSSLGI
jgi:hypothetical protein